MASRHKSPTAEIASLPAQMRGKQKSMVGRVRVIIALQMLSTINRASAMLTSTDSRESKVRTNTTEQSQRKHILAGHVQEQQSYSDCCPFSRVPFAQVTKEATTIPPLECSESTVSLFVYVPFSLSGGFSLLFPLHGAMALLGLSQSSTKPTTVRGEFFSEWRYGTM